MTVNQILMERGWVIVPNPDCSGYHKRYRGELHPNAKHDPDICEKCFATRRVCSCKNKQ